MQVDTGALKEKVREELSLAEVRRTQIRAEMGALERQMSELRERLLAIDIVEGTVSLFPRSQAIGQLSRESAHANRAVVSKP